MTKTSSITLFLCLVIFSFAAFGAAQTGQLPEPVRDTTGRALQRGNTYYIVPAAPGNGGGLTLAIGRNSSCPLEIVQLRNDNANGLPLRFSPVDNDTVVRVNTDHNIRFTNVLSPVSCRSSEVWQLVADGESPPPLFVTTGGVEGNPGRDTLPNWFKIQKYEDAYQIESCPSVPCQPCRVLCGNIGIFVDNGRRRLAINQPPFKIVFRRA